MGETQQTISKWADETFGSHGTNLSVAIRANEEMAELLACLRDSDGDERSLDEASDVIIVLMRLFSGFGVEFWDVVERKMGLNRQRTWRVHPGGYGYHE